MPSPGEFLHSSRGAVKEFTCVVGNGRRTFRVAITKPLAMSRGTLQRAFPTATKNYSQLQGGLRIVLRTQKPPVLPFSGIQVLDT